MSTLLFLDFDGVLHPLWAPAPFNDWQLEVTFGPTPYPGPFFLHAPGLGEVLRPYLPRLEIVVSSTWGRERSLADLRALLPEPIADRVVDATHHHLPPGAPGRTRWAEISWYRQHVRPRQGNGWLALDDDDAGWPSEQRDHLVHCRRDLGDVATRAELETALARWDAR